MSDKDTGSLRAEVQVNLDELKRKACAALLAGEELTCSVSNRAHIAANSPPVTLALIARIRELEQGYGDLLGEVEERSDNPAWYAEHAELLAKGAVLFVPVPTEE